MIHANWIVVIESEGGGPRVVGFTDQTRAKEWVKKYNQVSEKKWPHSFHNYAREPQAMIPAWKEWARMLREEMEE